MDQMGLPPIVSMRGTRLLEQVLRSSRARRSARLANIAAAVPGCPSSRPRVMEFAVINAALRPGGMMRQDRHEESRVCSMDVLELR